MSVLKTKTELEKRLAQNFPGVQIAYEGISFTPPEDQIYFRTIINREKTVDPVFGSLYRREMATFIVFVVAPFNRGTASAITYAEQIRSLFPRGLTIAVDNLRIQFFNTAEIAGTTGIDNRVVVPVMVPLTVEVFN